MAFLENLGKKVGEAAHSASKKSGELVEVSKINLSIRAEEDKINKKYLEIGKRAYELYISDPQSIPAFHGDCEAIQTHLDSIITLKEKIMEVKNIKLCVGCGEELDKEVMFCSKCGTKQKTIQQEVSQSAEGITCSGCGALVTKGSAFCQGCGTKVG